MSRIIFLIAGLQWMTVFGQNTIGFPEIINYPKSVYAAGTQNWDIKQDCNGILYFANNEGLLSYDGTFWKIYPLPNKTIVRSIAISPDGRIYIGGQDEIGFFFPDKTGSLRYNSLLGKIQITDRSFADVWDIVVYNKEVFFRSERKLLRLSDDHINVYNDAEWRFLGLSNNKLIAQGHNNNVLEFISGTWQPFITKNILPEGFLITAFVPCGKDSSYIMTLKNGIFILHQTDISRFDNPEISSISAKRIYGASYIDGDNFAIATTSGGCFIVNRNGALVQSFSNREGLQNNNILSVFLDRDKNLWLGLDNGIDFISYNNSIRHIYPDNQGLSSGYASIIYHKALYLGTSNGLYKVPLGKTNDLSYVKGNFELVEGTKGQVWNLSVVNDQLLMGHHEGAFNIKDNKAIPLDNSTTGFWNFLPYSNVWPSSIMIAGTYTGINIYNYQNNRFIKNKSIPFESARFIAFNDSIAWVAHPYKGIYRVDLFSATGQQVKLYNNKKGLFSVNNNYIFLVKNRIVVTTEKGILEYNAQHDSFEQSEYFKGIFGDLSIRYLKEDTQGNLWFVHDKRLGVVDMSGPAPLITYLPEMNNKLVSGFEHIYTIDENNILIGSEKGFYHIDYARYKKNNNKIQVLITSVKASDKKDSLLFGGYENNSVTPEISHKYHSFFFEFSSPLYAQQSNIEYSYHLKGFDNSWSDWTKKKEKEYSSLPPGSYVFQIKARNNLGNESAISNYSFTVTPPWYQSTFAYINYLIALIFIIFFSYRLLQQKFKAQQLKHEEENKRLLYMHQLEREKNEKEIDQLKIEKLETEIQYKNKELASTAMHLIQKGELLSKIKDEFHRIQKNESGLKDADSLKKLIKVLNEEDRMDEDWEHFTIHFDKVHSDFLLAFKNRYPALTANELKLCAYLRMNLSTKEIAQLMKISIRGVEISRYRLRKKLQIPTETNLFTFLLEFQSTV